MGIKHIAVAMGGLLCSPSAWAFCGHYVGGLDDTVGNASSQIVMVRNGSETVLTMANDFEGAPSEFAMLVPVPEGVDEASFSVLDAAVVDRLDAYSSPRVVSYACEDLYWAWDSGWYASDPAAGNIGCTTSSSRQDKRLDSGLTLESDGGRGPGEAELEGVVESERFTVGAYTMTLVEATDVDDLETWLGNRGFILTDEATPLLSEYIEGGLQFLAAEVLLEDGEDVDGSWLSPIQLRYDSDAMSLPVRLGTLSSTGVQDLIVYVLDESEAGISNYDEGQLEDECLTGDANATYAQAMDEASGDAERAVWIKEYTWNTSGCDPCPDAGAMDPEDLSALGWAGEPADAHLTRLHLRYRPDQVDADLALYASGAIAFGQVRYIQYDEDLESVFPICFEGMAEDPGECEPPEWVSEAEEEEEDEPEEVESSRCARLSGGSTSAALLLFGLGLARRRRS